MCLVVAVAAPTVVCDLKSPRRGTRRTRGPNVVPTGWMPNCVVGTRAGPRRPPSALPGRPRRMRPPQDTTHPKTQCNLGLTASWPIVQYCHGDAKYFTNYYKGGSLCCCARSSLILLFIHTCMHMNMHGAIEGKSNNMEIFHII